MSPRAYRRYYKALDRIRYLGGNAAGHCRLRWSIRKFGYEAAILLLMTE